jgi:hypothetical protein
MLDVLDLFFTKRTTLFFVPMAWRAAEAGCDHTGAHHHDVA